MSITRIIFLVETPILNRYYKRYGIEELRHLGFETSIWDLSPMILPITYKTITFDLCDYEKCGFERVFCKKELYLLLGKTDAESTLFICSMGYKWEFRHVFQAMRKNGFRFCYFMQDMSPIDVPNDNKSILDKASPVYILNAIKRRIPRKLHFVKNADFLIGCGEDEISIAQYKKHRLCDDDCPIHFFHSANYEECLSIQNLPRLIENRYCVFVDQFFPYHPDTVELGIHFDAEDYFDNMRRLFDYIENAYGFEVVVAAHPRSNYELHPGVFGDRRILKNETCRLVRDSEFVIYHHSNSLAYVTLFRKPVIVVTTNDINRVRINCINKICELLGTSEINMDDFKSGDGLKEQIDARLKINEEAYNSYIRKYVKKEYSGKIEGEPLWIQIGSFLREV